MEAEGSHDAGSAGRSRMSITELCNTSVHPDDAMETTDGEGASHAHDVPSSIIYKSTTEEEMAAIAALGHLRRGDAAAADADADASTDKTDAAEKPAASGEDFISRVANIPLVKSTIRLYDKSKAHSRVVKVS
ncbi:hypothetical protein SYNPS1DRAFT_30127 [Syncephalis pseudoplumigaleata]|uniref:Uncharacterized protein n=1 Tax=Syncephalis pseudoplumigaleata TaxID=1712513 RepID=A0A4P9YW83_9FUNG|nr:hypothetical protein SYNPS1DRAFT_30886 [Syncephalis pseudoplumigaleata]RKP24108.1 hypothetical protein SYNPS1DRAFT_30127 [Syncephalis pseudoplumigaleata]|eukprot:RKP23374.1 hypothetical protein SYNPS1DRAFT_30886 [Syncephalis pseudoplumigaleata]